MEGSAQSSIRMRGVFSKWGTGVLGINLLAVSLVVPAAFANVGLRDWALCTIPMATLVFGVLSSSRTPWTATVARVIGVPLTTVAVAYATLTPYPNELLIPSALSILAFWLAVSQDDKRARPLAEVQSVPLDPWPRIKSKPRSRALRLMLLSVCGVLAVFLIVLIPLSQAVSGGTRSQAGAPAPTITILFGFLVTFVATVFIVAPGFRTRFSTSQDRYISRGQRLFGLAFSISLGTGFYVLYKLAS